MHQRSASKKTTQSPASPNHLEAAAGASGLAVAPPAYGIDALDRASGSPEPQFAQERQAAPQSGAVQMRAAVSTAGDEAEARPENRTGLPDQLKTGIEHLSGLSLDDVNVYYNSPEPAQLQALAYTKGTDIYVGPGQQRHLPHEAWHVVQQKQGRVRATAQMKGVNINDEAGLEQEASVMGAKALQPAYQTGTPNVSKGQTTQLKRDGAIQLLLKYPYDQQGDRLEGPPQKIDLDTATYQELINYKAIWNEKQLGAAHSQWVFENGDVARIDQLIAAKEADVNVVNTVICQEGEVKVALPTQRMDFRDITSCMAISIVLNDGTIISAHNGIMAPADQTGGIASINQIKNNRFPLLQIVRVLAVGAGDLWDTRIRGQYHPNHNDRALVSRNQAAFVAYLRQQLNAPAGRFHEHNRGRASISAAGAYVNG